MSEIIFYALNKDIEVSKYTSLDFAKKTKPEWIIQESTSVEINGNYKNIMLDYIFYNANGVVVNEITDGRWKLIKLICYRNEFFQKVVISCKAVDPNGRICGVELNNTGIEGVIQAFKKLRKFSKFENLENLLLSNENEKLKKEIEKLKIKLGIK
ncbi:hypothetical protein [Hymenobacter sp. APR13]|uniref:hypothetical protein n=1 Tax=Hymenobacter sp. APR13 TaxID=1356852 RepID=UPI0004E0809C|nr:hypothetical protein [Hymenobacter sp. APR13]AII50389.1 hypothetical protein N008_00125 [Hymenobacter sp. APR13]